MNNNEFRDKRKIKYNPIRRIYNRIIFYNPDSCIKINRDDYVKEKPSAKYYAYSVVKH